MIELVLLVVSALFGSGVLFWHKRVLTYLAFAGVLFEAEILLSAFIRRSFIHTISGPTFYLVAGIIFLALFASLYKYWKSPYKVPGSGKRDGFIAIALVVVLAIAYPIISSNGYHGDNFILHGFYNGDTVTFASLVNKSFTTRISNIITWCVCRFLFSNRNWNKLVAIFRPFIIRTNSYNYSDILFSVGYHISRTEES
jgi:hypothetical protein